jgi:PAS domain S-box-containing protein
MDLLLVEDSPTDRLLMHNRLRRAFPKAQIGIADNAHQLADMLREDDCKVVVTDYWLGWSDGLSVLQRVKERWPRVRVIILTGNGGEEVVAEAFKFGLYHYLLKPEGFDNLVEVVRAAFESKSREDRSELTAALLQSLLDAIFCVDSEGRISTWNAAAERLYGYLSESVIGHTVEILLPPTARQDILQRHEMARRGETVSNFETTILKADSSPVKVTMTIIPVLSGPDTIAIACISAAPSVANGEAMPATADVVDIASRAHVERPPKHQSPLASSAANRC